MDAATLRRLLSPFERNVLVLLARYRGNAQEVADELRGGWEKEDKNGDLRHVGRGNKVPVEAVLEAATSARAKIRRHVERAMNENGGSATLDEPAPVTEDGGIDDLSHLNRPPDRLGDRPDAPRMRHQDPQAAIANREAGIGRGRQRRPGEAAYAVVQFVREHGPVSSLKTREACGIHQTTMPSMVQKLVDQDALVRTGEMDGRSPMLAIGPKADDVKPPKDATERAGKDAGARSSRESPAGAGDASPPAASATDEKLLGRYIDALLGRILNGSECPDRVYDYIEAQLK